MFLGDLKIEGKFNITGRGPVFTARLSDNNLADITTQDSFTYSDKWYKIRGIEMVQHRSASDMVGLLITEIQPRVTAELITELPENYIFVFGSNLSGRHGKGAAKQALTWGAIWGQAAGLQGRTYGIPTKDKSIRRTLDVDEIKPFVDDYIEFAKSRPDLIFLTTEIGCGLAGYKPKFIAPLFKNAVDVDNIWLPPRFWHKLKPVRTGLF